MTEGEENIIIKGVLLEAISRDFSEELSNNKEVSVSQPLGRFLDVKIQIFGMNPARLTRLGRLRLLGTISKLRLSIIFLIC